MAPDTCSWARWEERRTIQCGCTTCAPTPRSRSATTRRSRRCASRRSPTTPSARGCGSWRWRRIHRTRSTRPRPPGKFGVAAFDFSTGTLTMTEAGTKKRASLVVVHGEAALSDHDPGGLEPLESDLGTFRTALTAENHTVKRVLTDPRVFSGIGNA